MSKSDCPHLVYALGPDCKPAHFLEIVPADEDVNEVCDRWWKAFETGEKKPPGEYKGISHRPVVGFETWPDGEEQR